MRHFVEADLLIEIAVTIRSRPGEDKHLHSRRRAIGRRGKICVIRAGRVLRLGTYEITGETTTTEVVVLEVARGFSKAQLVNAIVIPVGPEEQVSDCTHAI